MEKAILPAARSCRRLHELSEEIVQIAASFAVHDARWEAPTGVDGPFVRSVIKARGVRRRIFGPDLFADPAWDMMLDLFASELEGAAVCVSSLCAAANVPASTAIRRISTLVNQGAFVRDLDPMDGRRVFIRLSKEASRKVRKTLEESALISSVVM